MGMRIGLDFDNTIVSYDQLFHKVAQEQAVIPPEMPANKLAIRDYLRKMDQENIWTEMQGTVYGGRMLEAQAYPGALDFILGAKAAGHTVAIISHRSHYNYLGPRYDLHAAGRSWIDRYLREEGHFLIPEERVFFELSKEEKWARIRHFGCELFVDDLPEILQSPAFPAGTRRFLFDPQGHHQDKNLGDIQLVSSWQALSACLGL